MLFAILLSVMAFAGAVYAFERYYRAPGQEVLYGTWQVPDYPTSDPVYYRFGIDHRITMGFSCGGKFCGEPNGKWYAGGTLIFIRWDRQADDIGPRPMLILRMVDIQPEELHVRHIGDRGVVIYRRVHFDSPNASNQAMQRTAGRSAF